MIYRQDILTKGHLDNSIRICIEEGIAPIRAIQMATINAAQCCQLTDRAQLHQGCGAIWSSSLI